MAEVDQRARHPEAWPSNLLLRAWPLSARAIRFADIPAEVITLAKTHVLDQLGVGLVATLDRNRPLAALATAFGTGGHSTALGFAIPLTAAAAALRNGALKHSLEYDGTHTASITHAGSVVAPVALAVCEETGASGANLLRAFILGWEMFVLLGLAAPGPFSKRGVQFTAVGGPFAGALTAGLLLGFEVEEMTNALGVAGSQASGVMEFVYEGATVKAPHAGWPAPCGRAGRAPCGTARRGWDDGSVAHPRGYARFLRCICQ
jgi:2-methylcitrate dehydratase PrpD